jgi:hypothetical protein
MRRLHSVMKFRPIRLRSAVEEALELHPNTSRVLSAVEGSYLEELIEGLQACAADTEALARFGAELTGREHRGLIGALIQQDESLNARILGALRPNLERYSVAPLWRAWIKAPRDRSTLTLLRAAAEEHGMVEAVAPHWVATADDWMIGEPIRRITDWADGEALQLRDLGRLAETPFPPDVPLLDELWRYVLTEGSGEQLSREEIVEVRTKGFELGPADVQLFAQNYLSRIPDQDWDTPVLEGVREKYGLPGAQGSRERFWRGVPDDARGKFSRRFLESELERAFDGDESSDRHVFWERYLDDMRAIDRGVAGSTAYAIMEFPTFGVVEFFRKDNAAYFYSLEEIKRFRSIRPTDPRDLKTGRDRLIHRRGWEFLAHVTMMSRLRLFRFRS